MMNTYSSRLPAAATCCWNWTVKSTSAPHLSWTDVLGKTSAEKPSLTFKELFLVSVVSAMYVVNVAVSCHTYIYFLWYIKYIFDEQLRQEMQRSMFIEAVHRT